MRKSKFTEHQIVSMLKQHEAGSKVADICREHGISNATFYQWKAKYGGLDASHRYNRRRADDAAATVRGGAAWRPDESALPTLSLLFTF